MRNLTKKIPVAILGATGMVGQKFVALLANHPWFQIVALAASERSTAKNYGTAVQWRMETPLPAAIASMEVLPCKPDLPARLVFSGLDSSVAGPIEEQFAQAGYIVVSNARNHRLDPFVPLLVPEVNADHLSLIQSQPYAPGAIITNPNCSVIGLVMALKPLQHRWGIEKVQVVTLQALSGAGYPGVPSFDIVDNVIPFISGEEEKIEQEPLKILGTLTPEGIQPAALSISAQCNRVPVMDGHLACVSLKLSGRAEADEIIQSWLNFSAEPQRLKLPTAPINPLIYHLDEKHPQPKLHRHLAQGMGVSIGRLRRCVLHDWKFVILSHNTVRGAAGCALLNAELMVQKKLI